MTRGILGFNTRTLSVSRDMELAAIRQSGGAYHLIMDDPDLAAQAQAEGARVVYRQSGDDANGNPLMQDPGAFVAKRAQNAPTADLLHLTNELDVPTLALLSWTHAAMQYADNIGRKVCLFNFSTNRDAGTWRVCEPLIQEAVARGHAIGLHAYFDTDPEHDAGAWAWQDIKHRVGGLWMVTEFAYIRDIRDGGKGWRNAISEAAYSAFLTRYVPRFAAENMPLCCFAFDDWPTWDKENGFGIHDAPNVLQMMAALNTRYPYQGETPMPTASLPAVLGDPVRVVVTAPAGLNLRSNAGTDFFTLGKVASGERLNYYPLTEMKANGYPWVVVKLDNGLFGWAARTDRDGFLWMEAVDVPTPTPVPPPAPQPDVQGALDELNLAVVAQLEANTRVQNAIARLKGALLPNTGDTF